MHVAMEDSSASKAGFITLSNDKGWNLRSFSTKLVKCVCQSDKIFPIRWHKWHSCHIGANFYPIVENTLKALMSPFQWETLCFHNGTDDEVVEELTSKYSFNRECIPENLGE